MQAPGGGVEWEVGGRDGVCTAAESGSPCNAPVCTAVVIPNTTLTAFCSEINHDFSLRFRKCKDIIITKVYCMKMNTPVHCITLTDRVRSYMTKTFELFVEKRQL